MHRAQQSAQNIVGAGWALEGPLSAHRARTIRLKTDQIRTHMGPSNGPPCVVPRTCMYWVCSTCVATCPSV